MSTFSFVWYNTENFYDTVDDPNTLDDDFTPKGINHWTNERFEDKAEKVSHLIENIVAPNIPDIVGLAEIENKSVVMTLIDHLAATGSKSYSFVHYDSPDERGIDIAMLYNTQTFQVLDSKPILVQLPDIEDRTRDILYVKGETKNHDIFYLFFAHFPSRREGTDNSEQRRFFVASELKNAVNKVFIDDPSALIFIMGDFNDTPDNHSINEVLGAQQTFDHPQSQQLYNLLAPRFHRGMGSTYYKGWLLFDQIIVSGNVLLSTSFSCRPEDADVFNPRFLLHFSNHGQAVPNRTYRHDYVGGYSDHLPVYLRISLKD